MNPGRASSIFNRLQDINIFVFLSKLKLNSLIICLTFFCNKRIDFNLDQHKTSRSEPEFEYLRPHKYGGELRDICMYLKYCFLILYETMLVYVYKYRCV